MQTSMKAMVGLGYLIPEFPSQTHIFIWREIEQLRRRGVDPVLFSTRRPQQNNCPHTFAAAAIPATTYLFPPRFWPSLSALLSNPIGLFKALLILLTMEGGLRLRLKAFGLLICGAFLKSQCHRQGVGHLHVHSCADSALAAVFCQTLGGPSYSLTLHNPLSVFGPNQRLKWRRASFAIVITQTLFNEVRAQLSGNLPSVIRVAPMGVDLDSFRRSLEYTSWQPSRGVCRIFSCGRLNQCKGHDLLIEAVALLRRENIDARLVIAGEDIDSPNQETRLELEQLRAKHELDEFVSLPGALSEDQVREQLEQAHIFALCSHAEPLGVVIMEAMAMELPVVATSAGGVGELVQDEVNGRLAPPGDHVAVARAIKEILFDPKRAKSLGVAGRRTVEERFGSQVSAGTLLEGLETLR